jgi:hypothetical protein
MSHFAVLVIGEGVEEKLHPYEELHLSLDEWETDPRAVFEVEIEDNPESISEYLTKNLSSWRDDLERADRTVSDLERMGSRVPGATLDAACTWLSACKANVKRIRAAIADPSLATEVIDEFDGYRYVPGKGYGYYHNPNSMWDWWVIGGRYRGLLLLKDGKTGELGEPSWCNKGEIPDGVDIACVEHIDWDRMDAREREDASRRWDEAKAKLSDTRFKDLYGDDCDKEAFLKEEGVFSTYAVITDDGEWHSPGKVGWFGASSDTPEEATEFAMSFRERFIDSLPDGTRITIVDCHI